MGQPKDNRQFITAVTPILWMLTFWWPLSCGCTVVASGNHRNSFLNLFLCSLPGLKTPFFQDFFLAHPTKQQSATTSFSTQIVPFSWHLCNRRDAQAESPTHAKRTIVRKKLSAKTNIFALNKTENTYRLFNSDY